LQKIIIGREAYDKIFYYVHKAKHEISGFGDVEIIKGVPTVTNIFLIEQENGAVETEMKAEAISKALYHHTISETMNGEMKFWWHSHVDMKVFWSGTDMDTINQLTQNGWWIHGVFNKKNEHRLSYSNLDPIPVFIDNIDLEIDNGMVYDENILNNDLQIDALNKQIDDLNEKHQEYLGDLCDQDFDDLVTIKTYTPSWKGNFGYEDYTGNKTEGKSQAQIELETHSTSTIFSADFCEQIYYHYGAVELFNYGYNEEEILILQNEFWINDLADMHDSEAEFGPIKPRILERIIENKTWDERHAK